MVNKQTNKNGEIMKTMIMLISVLIATCSIAYAEPVTGELTGTGPESVALDPEQSVGIWVSEVRAKFSAVVSTTADVVTVQVDSDQGATYDMMFCAPDADSDGTANIGATQYVDCFFPAPGFYLNPGDVMDFNFTNSDGLTGTIELIYNF